MKHIVTSHTEEKCIKIKRKIFDPILGIQGYQTYSFNISPNDIAEKINEGAKVYIDFDLKKIRFKRKSSITTQAQADDDDMYNLFRDSLEYLKCIDRQQDFLNLLKALVAGFLRDNIAFHLVLDIGKFYGLDDIRTMRYDEISLNFWTTVKCLFKRKGLNFFRGFMGDGLKTLGYEILKPQDCKVNFVVPDRRALNKELGDVNIDFKQPGTKFK